MRQSSSSKLVKNVGEAVDARQKLAKKRSLYGINEPFETIFNAAAATQVVFRRLAGLAKPLVSGLLFIRSFHVGLGESTSPLRLIQQPVFFMARPPLPRFWEALIYVTSEGRLVAAGAQDAQCICEYMSSPSTAGGQDAKRSNKSVLPLNPGEGQHE